MYAKYRIYLQTKRGGYYMAASDTVNGLAKLALDWFNGTSVGRSVFDDIIIAVVLMKLDPKTSAYERESKLPATTRKMVLSQIRVMGAR